MTIISNLGRNHADIPTLDLEDIAGRLQRLARTYRGIIRFDNVPYTHDGETYNSTFDILDERGRTYVVPR